jgi:hypothetical protein
MNFEQPQSLEEDKIEIKLSGDKVIVQALENKLKEYEDRMESQKNAGKFEEVVNTPEYLSNRYKYLFLGKLLKNGVVNKHDLFNLINNHETINGKLFFGAFDVIEDYNATGGKNNSGGGLKIEQK